MEFLKSPKAKLVCSDLSSKLNLTGWYNVPCDHISFWDNEILKTGKHTFRFIMTPHVRSPSDDMIQLYRAVGIFGSEEPVRQSTRRLVKLEPMIVLPMHRSCIDASMFPSYTDAIMKNDFAYSGTILGQKVPIVT